MHGSYQGGCQKHCHRADGIFDSNRFLLYVICPNFLNETECSWRMCCSIVVHARLLHPAQSYDQLAKKLVSLHAISLARYAKARSQKQSTASLAMAQAISSRELSCLANCRPLHASVHYYLINVLSIQEASVLSLVPIHGQHLFLASNAQWPKIKHLDLKDKIIFCWPSVTDAQL